MDRIVIFFVGAFTSAVSEIFWRGRYRRSIALWGGVGMLLLRRIVLRFPFESRALLCLGGALLLIVLWLTCVLIHEIRMKGSYIPSLSLPSFSYSLYRFLLIAPAYTIIEYLESLFRM